MRKTTRVSEMIVVCDSIIGNPEELAIQLVNSSGYALRVTRRDSENYIITMDIRFDRINVEIDNGLVTKSKIG